MAIVDIEAKSGRWKKGSDTLRKTYTQAIVLDRQTMENLRLLSAVLTCLWNKALGYCDNLLEERRGGVKGPGITAFTLNYWLTSVKGESVTLPNGTEVPLSDVGTDVMRELLRKLAGSWQSYFELRKKNDTQARAPRSKDGSRFQTISWSSLSINEGKLFVLGFGKQRIAIPLPDYLRSKVVGTVKHATITHHAEDDSFHLNLVCAMGAVPAVSQNTSFVRAVDLGAGDVAIADSDGTVFLVSARRGDKHWRQQIKAVEDRTKNRTKGSRSYKKLMRARRTMFNRSEHQHASHQRKLADGIVDSKKVQCIVLGKPRTRLGLSRSEGGTSDQHWGSQNTGYMYQLARFIKEKAQERGVLVIDLPDPRREGSLTDPYAKLLAARSLLRDGMIRCNLTPLSQERRPVLKGFRFLA